MINIQLEKFAYMPTKEHAADAGWDLYAVEDLYIEPRSSVLVDTGVHIAIPYGCVGLIKSRSSMATKKNIMSDAGVIDSGYTGSIRVKLYNQSNQRQSIKKGDRICQLVILETNMERLCEVKSLENTERGNNGFGSTGR